MIKSKGVVQALLKDKWHLMESPMQWLILLYLLLLSSDNKVWREWSTPTIGWLRRYQEVDQERQPSSENIDYLGSQLRVIVSLLCGQ